MMLRFNSGSFTLRSERRTESSVMSLEGSGCAGIGGCAGFVICCTIANTPVAEQVMGVFTRSCLYAAIMVFTLGSAARSQEPSRLAANGWEVVGLPALNFDSDEGFGYGVLAEAYNYGNGARPYKYTIQPTV